MTGISDWQMNAIMWQAKAKELSEKLEQALAERDEARREVCLLDADILYGQILYAKERGWDCFKDEP